MADFAKKGPGIFKPAQLIDVEIPDSDDLNVLPVVTVSQSFGFTGCGDRTTKWTVLKSDLSETYVIGNPVGVPTAIGLRDLGLVTCQAQVVHTYEAEFAVYGNPGTIQIEVPSSLGLTNVEVEMRVFPSH